MCARAASNQRGETVIDYVRWVMVRKRDHHAPAPAAAVPELPEAVAVADLGSACPAIDRGAFDVALSGSPHRFEDYLAGERIDHVDGVTVEEAEHMIATRLYQNTAKVHFNQHSEGQGRFGRRLIYGGHVISLARALSFNGLANAFHIAAINGGRHVAPLFAGDTVFAWSEIPRPRLCPAGTTSARCASAPSQPRTVPAPTSRCARARATSRTSSSISTPGCSRLAGLEMRLPADATLIVVGAPDPAGDAIATANVAALVEAWRSESLPAFDLRPHDAFDDGGLEARLEEIGATTLVLCGEERAVAAAARNAAALGFHAFVVRDACWRNGPAAVGPDRAGTMVDAATALSAAAVAKARQRRGERGRP